MRDDFDSVVADRFEVVDDVPVPHTWSRVLSKLHDPAPTSISDADVTVFDLDSPSATAGPSNGAKRMTVAALLAAAAVVAFVLVSIRRIEPPSPAAQPAPTATLPPAPPPRALFGVEDEEFTPGTYFVDEVGGSPTPRIFVTVGEGWRNSLDQGAIRNDEVGVLTFSRPEQVFSDACHANDGSYPGSVTTMDGLVAALSEQGGWLDVTVPTDITVNGYHGKTFQRTAPTTFTGCSTTGDSPLRSFDSGDRPGGWGYYEAGEVETLRVLDVNGTVILITTRLKLANQDAVAVAGLATVLDSIRIEQLSAGSQGGP